MAPLIPIIVGIASAVSSIGGTIYSAVSSSQARHEARKDAERMATRNAMMATEAAAQKEQDFRRRAVAALSMERAYRGASGVSMEGTPLLTYYENMRQYERDALRIRAGGAAEATGWMERAAAAKSTYGGGSTGWQVGSTLLTGATDVFNLGTKAGWWGNQPSQQSDINFYDYGPSKSQGGSSGMW